MQQADRRPAGRRRPGRAHGARRPHRRQRRQAPHQRRRRARPRRSSPASAPPKASTALRGGLDAAIARGLAYAPYADMIWCETSEPDLAEARRFAEAMHARFPGKLLAYNCSPSFNWKKKLDDATIARFQRELGGHGLQVPVHHPGRLPRPEPRHVRSGAGYRERGMAAYSELQERRVPPEPKGRLHARSSTSGSSAPDTSTRLPSASRGGQSSTTALTGSTEEEQFVAVHH